MVEEILDVIHKKYIIDTIIHGGAKGADTLAGEWSAKNNVNVEVFYPDWDKFGKSAGFIRNARMLSESTLDLVIAFPGGNGTEHMIEISQKSKIKTIKICSNGSIIIL